MSSAPSVTVLITGANSGVGYAAAKVIASASEKYHIVMAGRSLDKVESAMSEIKASGIKGSLSTVQLDVTDEASIKAAAKHTEEQYGRLDVLINNAAVGGRERPDIRQRMQACMDTNVVGPAVVAETFRPLLLKASNPCSIYVTSGAGSLSRASEITAYSLSKDEAYRASKAALNMLAVVEARDYGPKGLRVFLLSPGFVVSNLRGTDEDARHGWGMNAGDPMVSGETILSLVEGERDADVGKFIRKEGVISW